MTPIRQPTRFSCLACCAAMITGQPLAEVFRELGHDGAERHFRFLEVAAYLNRHGFHLGLHRLEHAPPRHPALLIVRSYNGSGSHAVFWDGREVWDPEPANQGRRLRDYAVTEWWPIARYVD